MREFLHGKKSHFIFTLIACTVLLNACGGGQPYKISSGDEDLVSSDPFPSPTTTPPPGGGNGGGGSGALPPLSFTIEGTGYNDVEVQVLTRLVLKVAFKPGTQANPVAGTGFFPNYARMGVRLKVGEHEQPTAMLGNGFIAQYPAQKSSIINFAPDFAKTCNPNDTGCFETVTIKVTKPNNDYWCLNYGTFCSWTHVYETHPWNGTLYVQNDVTGPIPPN